MVNVVMQALSKRLQGQVLSGPETSATVMASDFLLEELERIVDRGGDVLPSSTATPTTSGSNGRIPMTKEERMLEAKRMILQDLEGEDVDSRKDGDEFNAMFGSGGIPSKKSNDEGPKGGGKYGMFY